MTNDCFHLFVGLLFMHISSIVKYLLKTLPNLFIALLIVLLLLSYKKYLCISDTNPWQLFFLAICDMLSHFLNSILKTWNFKFLWSTIYWCFPLWFVLFMYYIRALCLVLSCKKVLLCYLLSGSQKTFSLKGQRGYVLGFEIKYGLCCIFSSPSLLSYKSVKNYP